MSRRPDRPLVIQTGMRRQRPPIAQALDPDPTTAPPSSQTAPLPERRRRTNARRYVLGPTYLAKRSRRKDSTARVLERPEDLLTDGPNGRSTIKHDPFLRVNNVEVELIRYYHAGSYPFVYMKILDILEMLLYISLFIVSSFAAIDAFVINNSIYFIAGTVLNIAISVILKLGRVYYYYQKREIYGFSHEQWKWVITPTLFGLPIMIVAWFVFGRWYWSNASCCGKSESQPNLADNQAVTTFYASHTMLALTSCIALGLSARSLWAHMRPEVKLTPADHAIPLAELKDVIDDENDREPAEHNYTDDDLEDYTTDEDDDDDL